MTEHEQIPPRIPRALAITPPMIRTRMWDIEQELARLHEDIDANQREYDGLLEKNHFLVSEHNRLSMRLHQLTGEGVEDD